MACRLEEVRLPRCRDPPILAFFDFLFFSFCNFPCFFCAFLLPFPRMLGVPQREKIFFFLFRGFPCIEKKAGVGGSGWTSQKFHELHRKFSRDFPRTCLAVDFKSNAEVPRTSPGSFPDFPGSSPDLPRGQPFLWEA